MPYFGEQQQPPQQQPWGQPQQEQWGQPQQEQWGQPQQEQWGQAQIQQQQYNPQQQLSQGGPQVGGPQQSFSPVQQQGQVGEIGGPGGTEFYGGHNYMPPVQQPAPEPVPIGPDGGGFPGIGGGPPGMPGISPELQDFLDGLSNRYQPQPGMPGMPGMPGGGNPLIQMLLMMMMGAGGGMTTTGPGMPGPDFPKPGDGPDQGEPPKPKTRGVPDSWGSPPPVPDGDFPVTANIPGFGMFNGPVTIFNWIRDNIAAHGPMDGPGPEPGGGQKPAGRYPAHWGDPPNVQTADVTDLPGGYGQGSSTLAGWIQQNLDRDAQQVKWPIQIQQQGGDK